MKYYSTLPKTQKIGIVSSILTLLAIIISSWIALYGIDVNATDSNSQIDTELKLEAKLDKTIAAVNIISNTQSIIVTNQDHIMTAVETLEETAATNAKNANALNLKICQKLDVCEVLE